MRHCVEEHPNTTKHRARLYWNNHGNQQAPDPLLTLKELLSMAAKKKVKAKSSKAGLKQKMGNMKKKPGIKTKGQKGYI